MQPPAELNLHWLHGGASEKQIALVGASVRAAAQSAQRAGFCVTGIDLFGDADTLQACRRHCLIKDNQYDRLAQLCAGIPLLQVGGLVSHQPLIQRLQRRSQLLGPSISVCDRLRDPGFLRSLSRRAGIGFPTTLESPLSTSGRQLSRGVRWLGKRRISCGGLGVRWLSDPRDAGPQERIQQWIAGRNYGATLLSDGRRVRLLGVCRSLFTRHPDRPFVYAGSVGPLPIPSPIAAALQRLGEQVVATTAAAGLLNVDFVLDQGGQVWLLEINPRWSGSSELVDRWLTDAGRLDDASSLLGLAIEASRSMSSGAAADLIARPPNQRQLDQRQIDDAPRAHYWKRIVFAPAALRFQRGRFSELVGDDVGWHDLPAEGAEIGRREPVMTLIIKIDRDAANAALRIRALLRKCSRAIWACRL